MAVFGLGFADYMAISSSAGLLAALDRGDERIRKAFELWAAQGGKVMDEERWQRLVQRMKYAEADGTAGKIARGETLTALDGVLGHIAQEHMTGLGQTTTPNINFDCDVDFHWHPVDSQRLIQWAKQFGLQEEYVGELAKLHFEERQSVTKRSTLLKAVAAAGLSQASAESFLDSDEFVKDIWQSYGDTLRKHNLHSIPVFFFNGPSTNGGPFRGGSNDSCTKVHGSGNAEQFAAAFEEVLKRTSAGGYSVRALKGGSMDGLKKETEILPERSQEQNGSNTEGRAKQGTQRPKKGMKKGFLL